MTVQILKNIFNNIPKFKKHSTHTIFDIIIIGLSKIEINVRCQKFNISEVLNYNNLMYNALTILIVT